MLEPNLHQHLTVKWDVFSFLLRVISETFKVKTNLTNMRGRLAPFLTHTYVELTVLGQGMTVWISLIYKRTSPGLIT